MTATSEKIKHPHSSGPFNVERPYGEPGVYIAAADTSIVAKVWDNENTKGNALLLAASYDMLAALEGCAAMLEESAKMHRLAGNGSGHGELADSHAKIARTAIAKAKGEA